MRLREIQVAGWERVVEARDGAYHALIALHSTVLGPAVGGTRLWRYASTGDALHDVLRLSRGMTYKSALAGLDAGGGKSVILAPERIEDRAALFRAHGRAVQALGGAYVTADDVGTRAGDMDFIGEETAHVVGLSARSGDPSPRTARGVFRAIEAAVQHRSGAEGVRGLRVAVQGCGGVGRSLVSELRRAGAEVAVADVDAARADAVAAELGAEVVTPDVIHAIDADVFAPCALGGVLNEASIPELRAGIVAGGANNQLREPEDGARLAERGILYVPDYVANAGGVITGVHELRGRPAREAAARVEAIFDTATRVLRRAAQAGIPPHQAAGQLAEERIASAAGPLP
ncbi:Leu/Phe/Val dehydrogenase [Longimicrobium terrae]|uniref:Leucine dehydrogenase n=1 Tax=Longimicrobium terrae TaxID=1639882 RepID=A0A841GWE1_9BACT|nr:Glu/Leu/Phe/Val dehydrogenase [Longimicrobium terrae]MBB4634564.1 leucine dehydrogenase [Longimicrobium terrae]MBB6068546.1 leucine dehydrogenase [Longimicrobium terrae]NNC27734.1 Glu/Leu/Phe/Val dehydrogenase [Longimicrobium terrae]